MNQNYPINEIFETIQGEARFTGTPSTFVRFQGCPVGCPWCDTKHTWDLNPDNECLVDEMLAKTTDSPRYALMSSKQIGASCDRPGHVVITGGEPCMFDLRDLTGYLLHERAKSVQIETSGTYPIKVEQDVWVTVSPKFDMPGKYPVREDALWRADEIKMPVGKNRDIEKLCEIAKRYRPSLVWLQPLSQSQKATELCVEMATRYGFRVSIQTHKYLNVR